MGLARSIIEMIKADIKYYRLSKMKEEEYKSFLAEKYEENTGEKLDFNNIRTYTEKIQYAKLYESTPLKTRLSDKYLVREWVAKTIGQEYLIPLLGVWDNFGDIDFEKLPKKFVLKTNHSSGWNLVVEDKNKLNITKEKMKFNRWLRKNFAYSDGLELHYKDIDSKVIAEEYIEDKSGQLIDYRFLCFDGEIHYCWVGMDGENQRYGNIYDLEWNLQPWTFRGLPNSPHKIEKPDNFDEMLLITKKLAKGFSHVRVDLYNVNNKIYFGEMTFTSSKGYRLIRPDKYNESLGDLWNLGKKNEH